MIGVAEKTLSGNASPHHEDATRHDMAMHNSMVSSSAYDSLSHETHHVDRDHDLSEDKSVSHDEILHHAMMNMSGGGMMDDSACGYCQLLVHFPVIVWVFTPFIWLTLIISRAPPGSFFSYLPFSTLLFDFQPRAPPFK